MNRRGFLAALAGAFVADPERALWVPGKKLISVPKRPLSQMEVLGFHQTGYVIQTTYCPLYRPGDRFTFGLNGFTVLSFTVLSIKGGVLVVADC